MRNNFLHSAYKKSNLDEFAEVMFQLCEWPWELILCILDVLKFDFGEVDETMSKFAERPFENISCILAMQIRGMDEFTEVLF
jgi:hypothetical protein